MIKKNTLTAEQQGMHGALWNAYGLRNHPTCYGDYRGGCIVLLFSRPLARPSSLVFGWITSVSKERSQARTSAAAPNSCKFQGFDATQKNDKNKAKRNTNPSLVKI